MSKGQIKDTAMIRMIDNGMSQADIARKFKVSPAAVCKRLKQLKVKTSYAVATSKTSAIIDQKMNVIQELNSINDKTKAILKNAEADPHLALKAIGSIQQQISLAVDIYERIYSIDSVNKFNEEVLQVLEECDPDLRKKVIDRLNAKASLRRAVSFK